MVKIQELIGTRTLVHIQSKSDLLSLMPYLNYEMKYSYLRWFEAFGNTLCINIYNPQWVSYGYLSYYKTNTKWKDYNIVPSSQLFTTSIKEIWF